MKKVLYILLIIFQVSCVQSFLDTAPVSQIADGNFWENKGHFESFVIGIHSRMRNYGYNLFTLGEMRSDIFGDNPFGGDPTSGDERLWLNTLNSENPGISGFGGLYDNINQVNLLITRILETDILDEESENYFLGQAYGMRAFLYFHLLRSWENVCIHEMASEYFDIAALSKPASNASEIMNFIKSDIENSVSSFGENYAFYLNSKSYWSKAATLMLKAEVNLWSSQQMSGGSDDAEIAKNALLEIQNNLPSLALESNFEDIFSSTNKENNEIIFCFHYELDEQKFWNEEINWLLPQVSQLASFYDSIDDRSLDVTIDLAQERRNAMRRPIKISTYRKFNNLDSRKYVSIKAAYSKSGDGNYIMEGCYLNKFKGILDETMTRRYVDDYPIYRYADLLLMLAEAKSLLNEDFKDEINATRSRAFGDNYIESVHGYPNQEGDSNVEETLLRERLFEFIGEGKRWYDLRRFGKEYVFKYTTVNEEHQLLWPIDNNTLTNNRELIQNPGY